MTKIMFNCNNCRHKSAHSLYCEIQKRSIKMPVKCRFYKNKCSHFGELDERCEICALDNEKIFDCELGYK